MKLGANGFKGTVQLISNDDVWVLVDIVPNVRMGGAQYDLVPQQENLDYFNVTAEAFNRHLRHDSLPVAGGAHGEISTPSCMLSQSSTPAAGLSSSSTEQASEAWGASQANNPFFFLQASRVVIAASFFVQLSPPSPPKPFGIPGEISIARWNVQTIFGSVFTNQSLLRKKYSKLRGLLARHEVVGLQESRGSYADLEQ
eukprot:8783304-Pyramimonas_sp.AAC.1